MKKYKEVRPSGSINELETIISECLGGEARSPLESLYSLLDKVLEKQPLRDFGVKESDLSVFAKDVIATQQRLLKNNYIPLSEAQLLEIYTSAF